MAWTRTFPATLTLQIGAAAFSLCACREPPETVLESARTALKAHDDEGFYELIEDRAATLLRAGVEVGRQSAHGYKVLRDGRPSPALLPKGEITGVIESGHRAVVKVKQGPDVLKVPMRLVQGQWRIDLLEMDSFYKAIQPLQ